MKSKSTRPQRSLRNNVGIALALLIALSVLLSACTSPTPTAEPATQVPPPPTVDVALVQTQAAQTVVADLTAAAPVAEETEAASDSGDTAGVPVAILPTPAAGQPSAVAVVNTLLYTGPGTNYVVLGTMLGGRSAVVVGKSEDGAGGHWIYPCSDQNPGSMAFPLTSPMPVMPVPLDSPPALDHAHGAQPAEGGPSGHDPCERLRAQRSGRQLPGSWCCAGQNGLLCARDRQNYQDEEWYRRRTSILELVGVGYG